MTEDKMIDASFEVKFEVSYDVRNFNDDVINRTLIIEAAKEAARLEIARQLQASVSDGDFEIDS